MLPEVSLGLWQNFGDTKPLEDQRAILRRAFDLGVTHFDLANNFGAAVERHPQNTALTLGDVKCDWHHAYCSVADHRLPGGRFHRMKGGIARNCTRRQRSV